MNLFMVDSVGERRHVMCEGFHHQDGCWLVVGGKLGSLPDIVPPRLHFSLQSRAQPRASSEPIRWK